MKKLFSVLLLSALGICYVSAQYDDLYSTSSEKKKQREIQQEYKTQQKLEEAKQQKAYEDQFRSSQSSRSDFANGSTEELVQDVKTAYERRLEALTSSSTASKSYWDAMDDYYNYLERKYDLNLYNIMVINDKIWVEPKYITSVFDGSDPKEHLAAYKNSMAKNFIQQKRFSSSNNYGYNSSNININIYASPYYNNWYNPWGWNHYYGWGGGWNNYYGWGGGWNNHWWDPFYRPYPYWGGGWWGGHYPYPMYPVYYRDRHPSVQGNTRYGSRPSYRGGSSGSFYGNGVGGDFNRRPGGSAGSVLPSQRPQYVPSVTNNNSKYVPGMGYGNRPSGERPKYERPSERPIERPSFDRPTYDRPSFDRPTNNGGGGAITPPTQVTRGGGLRR